MLHEHVLNPRTYFQFSHVEPASSPHPAELGICQEASGPWQFESVGAEPALGLLWVLRT